ncbi:MAG TPA: proline dehydrogenase family protein, partial [Terriglobales bacterium]|nr:proline dehydrogenase family protein [Terriglobales bacterium]
MVAIVRIPADLTGIEDEVDALVRRWLVEAEAMPASASAKLLADLLQDRAGLAFAVQFIDGVIRPEDARVATAKLAELAGSLPHTLPWHLSTALRLGALAGGVAPMLVIPIVRRALRAMVGHLLVDAGDARLARAIEQIGRSGRLNINLLGEAVLGEREGQRRLDGTRRLLARDDVDYVSIKVSSVIAPHQPWAFDETVADVVERLTPLYRLAARSRPRKFINLDMEEYRDLDLTIAVFTKILDQPELRELEAGIVLQAYLPDALAAMMQLQPWSAERRAR